MRQIHAAKGSKMILKKVIVAVCVLSAVTAYARPPYTLEEVARYKDTKYLDMAKKMIADGGFEEQLDAALGQAARRSTLEMVELLIDAGADIHSKDEYDNTVMHAAAKSGNLDIAKFLFEKGGAFDETNRQGRTPLFDSAYNREEETALWLLDLGADPNVSPKTPNLSTPIFYAASKWQPSLARALIDKGANVDVTEAMAATPLHLAASHGNAEMVSLLIDAGADVNAVNEDGWTPLYYAVSPISLMVHMGDTAAVVDLLVRPHPKRVSDGSVQCSVFSVQARLGP